MFMSSSVSVMMCETARLRNHFLFDGITNQGAWGLLHAPARFIGSRVVVPEFPLREIGLGNLPAAVDIVDTLLKTAFSARLC